LPNWKKATLWTLAALAALPVLIYLLPSGLGFGLWGALGLYDRLFRLKVIEQEFIMVCDPAQCTPAAQRLRLLDDPRSFVFVRGQPLAPGEHARVRLTFRGDRLRGLRGWNIVEINGKPWTPPDGGVTANFGSPPLSPLDEAICDGVCLGAEVP